MVLTRPYPAHIALLGSNSDPSHSAHCPEQSPARKQAGSCKLSAWHGAGPRLGAVNFAERRCMRFGSTEGDLAGCSPDCSEKQLSLPAGMDLYGAYRALKLHVALNSSTSPKYTNLFSSDQNPAVLVLLIADFLCSSVGDVEQMISLHQK